ncbi:MAG: DUF2829 domain-containing protein [Proteobacteria bacterium]|nr:DUF2829 domain-containing protein [Pseudomonadota bacterium]
MTTLTNYIGTKIVGAMPEAASNGAEGYRIVYADGYTSWSPKEAFEQAYRKTDAMTFGDALVMLLRGCDVQRASRSRVKVRLVHPVKPDGPPASFISFPVEWKHAQQYTIYTPSIDDMLAEDWQVVE